MGQRIRAALLLLGAAAAFAGPGAADTWTNSTPGRADRAFYSTTSGGMQLQLGCFSRDTGLAFMLAGGATPLPEVGDLMVWIMLPDGRTGRYPMSGVDYLGGPENALIGQLLLGQQGMEFFAAGARISIDGPPGQEIFAAGMTGTSAARRDFARICGL